MNLNFRLLRLMALVGGVASFSSCMTTYDVHGRPVQSVDPGVAVAGVAAAGVLGYALANDKDHHHHHRTNHYYGRPRHHRHH
jgi:hypothetical protein